MLRAAFAVLVLSLAAATAEASSAVQVRDEGELHHVATNATQIIDIGHVAGTIPGEAKVDFTYNGSPSVSARFTIHSGGSSISGEAHATLSNPSSLTPSFAGKLEITGGSGRYAHARGSGKIYGVYHRHGYGLLIQARGELRT